jgi:hypothetical protein
LAWFKQLYSSSPSSLFDPPESIAWQKQLGRLERVPAVLTRLAMPPSYDLITIGVSRHDNAIALARTSWASHKR